ncbi:polyprenyl diphosphate synthase [Oceanivirga miroungae]|uniref:Isoprenyl transferase n=1 Tax=Oceanivirga miroungae TaxID=1130046 RepID=A0A6I8M4Q5_9FUSO|nr:polyprenyl diphosphate synthase [Oceanivirga miroungae]VWL84884.1 undecaprenyl diphosphate synthase [Oceanivirga miroungae]
MLEHLAIIMDGNGRWGIKNFNSRIKGHKQGVISLEECIKNCMEFDIKILSVYAFSTENWKRPKLEVNTLMKMFENYLIQKKAELNKNGIKLIISGSRSNLSNSLIEQIKNTEDFLKDNTKFTLNICFNYGGRDEIVKAVNKLINEGKSEINELDISSNLYSSLKDPDLIIRTGGDYRLSNFLIWQSSYSELYFTDTLWPDFNKDDLKKAIDSFYSRKRRFGGLDVK